MIAFLRSFPPLAISRRAVAMTLRHIATSPAVDLDLAAWHFLVESPRNVLLFDLSVINVCDPLKHVENEGFIQVLSPCGVIYLHHNRHIKRDGAGRYLERTGIFLPLLAVLLSALAEDEPGSPANIDESPGVGLARRLRQYYGLVDEVNVFRPRDDVPPLIGIFASSGWTAFFDGALGWR